MKMVKLLLMLFPSMLPDTLSAVEVGDFSPIGVGYEWKYAENGMASSLNGFHVPIFRDTGIVRVKINGKEVRGDSILYTGHFEDSVRYLYIAPGLDSQYQDYVISSEFKLLDGVGDTIKLISGNDHFSLPMMFGPHFYPDSEVTRDAAGVQIASFNANLGASVHAKDIGMQECFNGVAFSGSDYLNLVQFTRDGHPNSIQRTPDAGESRAGLRKSPNLFRYGNRDVSILGRRW